VAQKLYQAVQRIAKKLWKIDNSDELAIRTFARARAAYAYTLCKMERTGSDEPIASARGILGSQRRDSFAALCLDMCNTSPRPNLQDLLQAFDHARFAYLTIDDGLQLPLAWEISVRCTYAQRLLDVSRVIIDYMVVFKDISIERSRSFTDKVFSTLRSSTAMDLALRVVCPEVKESVPSYLLRCVSTFIAQCDEHFYTALEITKSKKGITPFERGLLIQKIEVARAFLRHTLIGESDLLKRHSQDSSFFNFNFGEPIQADHVTSSLESPTSIPAGRRTLLLTRIRDLIRTGAYADANTLLQEVSQYEFTLHEYIELEIERAFATTSGEPPAHIVARFQELFEMVNDAPDHDYRMRIRAYEHIFAASVQISESKDDALPLKVLNALGSLCIRHKLPNPAPALATIYGWTDLPALTDALHCLPRNFTIPESLWIALIDRVQTHSRRDASEKNAAASIHATLEAMAEYCRTCEKGDEKRIAEVTALRGNCFLPSSPYFPSLSALTDATDAAWRERKPDLQMNIHRLIADAANRDNNSMLLLRSCTTVFAIAEAFTLNNAEDKRHCSRLLGNRLFKIARSLVDNNARPRVAQVLKRLTILQNNYEFLRCFFLKTSMRLPEIEASALPRSSLLAFHPGLNTLARNLLVGPVAALLEDGATRNGVLDASETTLQRCLRLYK
jgi:hypothetical protein